ncbi:replication-relaxation family protein [Streptodolium elevatio]|uniref:Replication-relaxation family protein n=1 Tax=Streptodolium elevatio TaxID=3157996 RepID=A0ABV3D8V8_9ACTN
MISIATPQRALRGQIVPRPTSPAAVGADHLGLLARRLTPRDRWLARMLYEHRVFTTRQITELAWPQPRVANSRLLDLYKWRLLDRFQPRQDRGRAQMHYVLDLAGVAVLAYEDGLEPRRVKFSRDNAFGLAHSLRLAHMIATNGFFTALVHHGRTPGSTGRLTAWWSESRCAEHFGDIVKPDAYGRWTSPGADLEWFLEHDTGSERPAGKLGSKVLGYAKLAATTGIVTPVLFWTTTISREAAVRRALADAVPHLADPSLVPIATASIEQGVLDGASDPSCAAWLPLSRRATNRMPLVDLSAAWPRVQQPNSDESGQSAPASPQLNTTRADRINPPSPIPPKPIPFGVQHQ